MPPNLENSLFERIVEQARLEQLGDVEGLCQMILPAYRSSPVAASSPMTAFQQFVQNINNAQVESFSIESWEPVVARFGNVPAARVLTAVRYNGSARLSFFRTIWVYIEDVWYTTATGKLGMP
jgi:hypothetical protein